MENGNRIIVNILCKYFFDQSIIRDNLLNGLIFLNFSISFEKSGSKN